MTFTYVTFVTTRNSEVMKMDYATLAFVITTVGSLLYALLKKSQAAKLNTVQGQCISVVGDFADLTASAYSILKTPGGITADSLGNLAKEMETTWTDAKKVNDVVKTTLESKEEAVNNAVAST
jgi:hypothetical protein